MSAPAHRDPVVIAHGTAVLGELSEMCRSLVSSSLLTDDGFEVVSLPAAAVAAGRIASMASSLQALGDAVVRELRIGASEYVIVAAQHGHVVQLRVPGQTLVLSAMFSDGETVGKALAMSRQAVHKMSLLLAPAVP